MNTSTNPSSSEWPLFFKNPVMLDSARHGNAGIRNLASYAFAKGTNAIPINIAELHLVAKHYPVVFSATQEPVLLAIVGLEQKNDFVNHKGEWKKDVYIPAYVRRYPFILTDISHTQQLALCVDEDADHYVANASTNATRFYDEGKPSAMAKHALEFCTIFQSHFGATRAFASAMREEGLLVDHQSDVKFNDGHKLRLRGFQVVDQTKMDALTDEKIIAFHKNGWLPIIYFMFQSQSNWDTLVDLAAATRTRK
jgi:hypothetical protein